MDEPERPDAERPVVERETTIINTGERGGGGGTIAALVLLIVVAAIAFFFFGGYFEKAADELDVNVNVATPKVELPDINIDTSPSQPAQPAEPSNASGN